MSAGDGTSNWREAPPPSPPPLPPDALSFLVAEIQRFAHAYELFDASADVHLLITQPEALHVYFQHGVQGYRYCYACYLPARMPFVDLTIVARTVVETAIANAKQTPTGGY